MSVLKIVHPAEGLVASKVRSSFGSLCLYCAKASLKCIAVWSSSMPTALCAAYVPHAKMQYHNRQLKFNLKPRNLTQSFFTSVSVTCLSQSSYPSVVQKKAKQKHFFLTFL